MPVPNLRAESHGTEGVTVVSRRVQQYIQVQNGYTCNMCRLLDIYIYGYIKSYSNRKG